MLYLRDIEVDVHVRCCACGHEGVLPRALLQRRFGPNYPVLSIAPHYRCSRCDSRNVESRPAPPPVVAAATPAGAPTLDGPLAALRGLLDTVRQRGDGNGDEDGDSSAAGPKRAPERAESRKPEPHRPSAPAVEAAPAAPADRSIPLEQLVADGPAPDTARRPLWEPISLADMAARLDAEDADGAQPEAEAGSRDAGTRGDGGEPWPVMKGPTAALPEAEKETEAEPSPLDRSIAALRGMIDSDSGEEDEPPPVFSPMALVRRDFEPDGFEEEEETDFSDEDGEDAAEEEPSDDEILAFAIRDPEKAPPPWARARPADDEPLDRTIAALRAMVREAAEEPEEPAAPMPRPAAARRTTEEPSPRFRPMPVAAPAPFDDPAPDGPAFNDPPDGAEELELELELEPEPDLDADPDADSSGESVAEPEAAPRARKSAQEQEMEEALRALRALVEADDPEDPAPDPDLDGPREAHRKGSRDAAGWEEEETAFDLVEELPGETADGRDADRAGLSPLDRTIAALRGMLELDGKRGR